MTQQALAAANRLPETLDWLVLEEHAQIITFVDMKKKRPFTDDVLSKTFSSTLESLS